MLGVVGLAHIAIKVKEEARTLAFYRDGLGFPEMFRLNHEDGRLWLAYLRISDTQYLEVFPEAEGDAASRPGTNGIDHICLQVEGIDEVAERVKANGIALCRWTQTPDGPALLPDPDAAPVLGQDGNRQFWIKDPDGIRIEFMEMAEGSLQDQAIRRLAQNAS
ncbi:lactoylglutathione lyase [Kaistia sp. 32K]|uniref:VOC family protein n=1 Tax=Kaistia sp. 32K TaxID=2795690 RepID=UPI001915A18D|nr:VOC family protein [Kaistia sp. 32K]BCP51500.1 lactoylglutathione lyase [Kaistia sp. 32K]